MDPERLARLVDYSKAMHNLYVEYAKKPCLGAALILNQAINKMNDTGYTAFHIRKLVVEEITDTEREQWIIQAAEGKIWLDDENLILTSILMLKPEMVPQPKIVSIDASTDAVIDMYMQLRDGVDKCSLGTEDPNAN